MVVLCNLPTSLIAQNLPHFLPPLLIFFPYVRQELSPDALASPPPLTYASVYYIVYITFSHESTSVASYIVKKITLLFSRKACLFPRALSRYPLLWPLIKPTHVDARIISLLSPVFVRRRSTSKTKTPTQPPTCTLGRPTMMCLSLSLSHIPKHLRLGRQWASYSIANARRPLPNNPPIIPYFHESTPHPVERTPPR